MKGVTSDLFSPALRRVQHDGRKATLLYDPSTTHRAKTTRPPRRQTYGSRLSDGTLWAQAAWAEIAGLDPVIAYTVRGGVERVERPWRDRDAALTFLHAMLADSLGRATARKRLRDLVRRGAITEAQSVPGGTVGS